MRIATDNGLKRLEKSTETCFNPQNFYMDLAEIENNGETKIYFLKFAQEYNMVVNKPSDKCKHLLKFKAMR